MKFTFFKQQQSKYIFAGVTLSELCFNLQSDAVPATALKRKRYVIFLKRGSFDIPIHLICFFCLFELYEIDRKMKARNTIHINLTLVYVNKDRMILKVNDA